MPRKNQPNMKRLLLVLSVIISINTLGQIPITNRQWLNYQLLNDTSNNFQAFDLRGFNFNKNKTLGPEGLISKRSKEKSIQILPILNLGIGNETFASGAGAAVAFISKKFNGFIAPSIGVEKLSYLDLKSTLETHNIRGKGYAERFNGPTFLNAEIPFSLAYNPSKFFTLMIGNGRHHIGAGSSSVILSDYSRNHPYAAIQTKVWKLRYTNLFSGYYQENNTTQLFYNPNKFSTTHYLEIIASKKFTLGLFETVIFKSKDTLVTRSFDINYLNPIIFYRPVEYSTGSSDNVLMALNMTYNPFEKFQIFGQFLIDEFLFAYLRADIQHFINPSKPTADPWGWWANKHAGLLGFKWKEPFSIPGVLLHTEVSYARPYIFTHLNSKENYGNNNLPLSHHLGANFDQWLTYLTYAKNNLMVELSYRYWQQGLDEFSNQNWGSNINLSYNTRQSEFGNYLLQGYLSTYQKISFSANYLVIPQVNMSVFLNASYIQQNLPNNFTYREPLLNFGIKTNLFNNYTEI